MENRFPRVVGRYTLLRSLGRGGTGEAFLAAFGEPVRLCVLKMGVEDMDPDTVEKIEAEARVMLRISCPNIVSVLEAGQHEGRWYLAMELVDGRDLREIVRRARDRTMPVPISVAIFIVREIVRGLHYLHSHEDLRIIHRDVSPANVMVAFTGEVKLIDFGLARSASVESHTRPGMADGHFGYLAPERMAGRPYDHRADLFSAGLILWELLAGKEWFIWPENSSGVMIGLPPERSAALPSVSSLRKGIDPALNEIVRKSIAMDPADRYADAESMRVALAKYLGTIDAAADWGRVQSFVRPLFDEEIGASRLERERLLSSITPAGVAGPAPIAPIPHTPTEELPRDRSRHATARAALLVGAGTIITVAVGFALLRDPHRPAAPAIGGAAVHEPAPPTPPPIVTAAPPPTPLPTVTVPPPPTPPTIAAQGMPKGPLPAHQRGLARTRPVRAPSASKRIAPREGSALATPQAPLPLAAGPDLVRSARQALQNHDYDAAVELGKQALRAGGDPVGAHLALAATYYLLTRYAEARRHFEAALEVDPGNREATRGLATTREQLER